MRRHRLFASFFALVLATSVASSAGAQDTYFKTKAPYAIIMDYESGQVLYRKQEDIPMAPASMSKLMTVAIVFDMIKSGELTMETEFDVSEKAWRTRGGSTMFVLVKDKIKVSDLLKGIIVQSGNDACIVIAENISEDGTVEGFVKLMNKKASEWGLKNSTFTNPNGLPDENHLMSAYDLAVLTRRIIRDYPDQFALFALPEFTWSEITQSNRNTLLKSFPGADGMKTGHTSDSGFGIVGTAFQDQQRRIIVLNGLDSYSARTREASRVMELAFSEFDTRKYLSSGEQVLEAEVFMGLKPSVPLEIRNDVAFTLHVKPLNQIEAKVVYQGPLRAPLTKGDQVAVLRVTMPGEPVHEYPLYAAEDVKEIGMFGKIKAGLASLLTPPNAEDV